MRRKESREVFFVLTAVAPIAHKGKASGGKLYPDLVRAPGVEPNPHKSAGLSRNLADAKAYKGEPGLLHAGTHTVHHIGFSAFAVSEQQILQDTLLWGQPFHDGKILFFCLPCGDFR